MENRHHWRCSKEKCKARYSGALHPDEYKRGWKCKACGGSKFRMIMNRAKDRCDVLCDCQAYLWHGPSGIAPHRRGSRACSYDANGTLRVPVRQQSDRLHSQAFRMIAEHDKNGPVFWFYDGEYENEATWASEPDTCIAQLGGLQSLLELQAASTLGGQPCSPAELAQWVDGATRSRDAAVGRFLAYKGNLRRSR